MPSFDVVSRTDLMEVDNSINGVRREINQRYDLKGTKCDISRSEDSLTLIADDTMKMTQLNELLRKYLASRKIEQGAFVFEEPETAGGGTVKQIVSIKQGIDTELARKITKAIKSAKMKVQVSIQGTELRISAKKRDDLQSTIQFIKEMSIVQPLQYINYRE